MVVGQTVTTMTSAVSTVFATSSLTSVYGSSPYNGTVPGYTISTQPGYYAHVCASAYGSFTVSGNSEFAFSITTTLPMQFLIMTPDQLTGAAGQCSEVGAQFSANLEGNSPYSTVWSPPSPGVYYWVLLNPYSADATYSLSVYAIVSQIQTYTSMSTLTSQEQMPLTSLVQTSVVSLVSTPSFASPDQYFWAELVVAVLVVVILISLILNGRRARGKEGKTG